MLDFASKAHTTWFYSAFCTSPRFTEKGGDCGQQPEEKELATKCGTKQTTFGIIGVAGGLGKFDKLVVSERTLDCEGTSTDPFRCYLTGLHYQNLYTLVVDCLLSILHLYSFPLSSPPLYYSASDTATLWSATVKT